MGKNESKLDYLEDRVELNGVAIPAHLIRSEKRMKKVGDVSLRRQEDLTIVLENVHDSHNISACIRSCDAVGIIKIHVVNSIAPKPYRRLGKKSSAGSVKWIDVEKWDSIDKCYQHLRSQGFQIYSTAIGEQSTSIYNMDFTKPTALVFGNEHDGVSEEAKSLADGNCLVPQMGMIESLNISVACAVSLFEAMRQKLSAGHYQNSRIDSLIYSELLKKMLSK